MALSSLDALRQQARNASQEDIDKLCKGILDVMHIPEKAGDLNNLLRQLCFILQASDEEPLISVKLLSSLLSAVCPSVDKSNPRQCLLCQQIVQELLPSDGEQGEIIRPRDKLQVNRDHLPFHLAQGERLGCLDHSFPEAVKWVCTKGYDLDSQRKAFMFLVSVSMMHSTRMSTKVVKSTSDQMSRWLMTASMHQAANPYTKNPFRKDESNLVTEIDGTPSRNFFTVLNIGQYYTDDQFLNIYSFSLLYRWLYHTRYIDQDVDSKDSDLSEGQGRTTPMSISFSQGRTTPMSTPMSYGSPRLSGSGSLASTPTESSFRVGTPLSVTMDSPRRSGTPDSISGRSAQVFGTLSTRTVDYCFRVLDQCERKPKASADAELQMACLSEAMTVLDLICQLDSSHVPRIHQEVKRLYARVSQEAQYAPIVTNILQFFLNHSKTVVHDPGDALQHYFRNVLSRNFHDAGLAFDSVRFILKNLETLCHKSKVLATYFPNVLKILAWHPRTFLTEFVDILPAVMYPNTAMEVFHSLLDLPCLTAALEVIEKAKRQENIGQTSSGESEPTNSVDAFQHPFYRPLFSFVTRYDSGHGDTLDKLSSLHAVLSDLKSHPRVLVCSQTVPVLIRVWFSVILDEADEQFASQLLPVLLERSAMLFAIPEFQADIQRLLAENLVHLLKSYPPIVTSQYSEISSFLMSTRTFSDREAIFSNLIWSIGEFCSLHHDARCTSDLIGKYYETLEAMAYEVSGMLLSGEHKQDVSPKIVSVLVSAIAKLATRCQDLIPRAILCLTKVAKQHYNNAADPDGSEALVSRTHELINLLKLPNFASVVLNPSPDIDSGRWHRDNTALPILLRGTYRLVSPDSI